MISNIDVKIDKAGRVIIPKKVRKHFGIKTNDRLLLTVDKNGIFLKKDNYDEEYLKLINKISFLEKLFDINFILVKDCTIIDASDCYKKHIGEKTNFDLSSFNDLSIINKLSLNNNLSITNTYYHSFYINHYTFISTFIIMNDIKQKKLLHSYLKAIF